MQYYSLYVSGNSKDWLKVKEPFWYRADPEANESWGHRRFSGRVPDILESREPLKATLWDRVAPTGASIGGSMAKDIFRDRERGEEEAYFRQEDAKLIAKLRQKAQLSEIAQALAEKLHVDEPALLERIRKLGVTLDTGSAFILAPLVEVAWVDGQVSNAERDTILEIANQRGVEPGSADYRQLLDWLEHRPSDELFRAALEAIRIGLSVLPPDESEKRIATIIKTCEDVAQATGGIAELLHLDGVSYAESTLIAEIRRHLAT